MTAAADRPGHPPVPVPVPRPRPFEPTEPFRPATGLSSGHAQTIFAHLFRPAHVPPLRRDRIDLPDGDFVDVDRLVARPDAPHVVILHGLEGSSKVSYVAALLRDCHARGWGAIAFNFRGCSGEPNRLPRAYHSGDTDDVRHVIEQLGTEVSGPIAAAGFSLGANVLLKLLGEDGDRSPIVAAAAMSAPFDLLACGRMLDARGGFHSIYRLRFTRQLVDKALAKARRFPHKVDARRVMASRGLEGFDNAYTAPVHGYASAFDYYRACSSGPFLSAIRRPTLVLTAGDDPVSPASTLPLEARDNPALSVIITDHGGHVGFVSGTPLTPRFWGENQMMAFLDGHL